jgi:Tfp pilus assembly protein PilF
MPSANTMHAPREAGTAPRPTAERTHAAAASAATTNHGRRSAIIALVLVTAALAFYRNSFAVPFVYDDVPAIAGNPSIQSLWTSLAPPPHLTTSGRPLVNLTLAINHALGGTDVWGYHAMNLAIHVLAAVTLCGLVRRTLLLPRLKARFSSAAIPLSAAIAGLWLLHPLQTEAVTYVVQRAESLVGLFYLLTLYAFVRGVGLQEETEGPDNSVPSGRTWFGIAIASCWAGMATKEVMVSAPLLVLLFDRTFIAGTFRAAWKRRRGVYVGLAASWLLLAALIATTGGTRDGSAGFGQGMAWWAYALTQAKAISVYVGLALWPQRLVFDYGSSVVPPREAWPYAIAVALLLAGSVVALRRRSPAGFLGAAFFAILAPSSSVLPVVTETMAEHRMYLPLAVLIVAAVLGTYAWLRRPALPLWLGCAIVLGCATSHRNETYGDHVTLWADTVTKQPANPRAHNQLGSALATSGHEAEALIQYIEAVRLDPLDAKAQFNVATACARAGRADDAMRAFEIALRLNPQHADAHNNYGDLLLRLGRHDEAIAHFRTALRLDPGFAPAHNNLGIAFGSAGELEAAIVQFQAARRERPDYAEALNNLGFALKSLGRMGEAIPCFQAAVRVAPRYAEAHNNLALALAAAGRTTESIYHFREVIRLEPGYADARDNLARILNPAPR